MLTRKIQLLPGYIYPPDEWRLVEKRFYPRLLAQTETLFATANGYLGIRGCFEEGNPVVHGGTFINGFHETWPIVYPEEAFGFAKTGQTLVEVPDGKLIRLYVDDEPFDISKANLIEYERVFDMRAGTLDRDVVWEKHSGKRIRIRSRRLVSFVHRHIAALCYEVTLLNADAPIVLSSELVCPSLDRAVAKDPRGTRAFTTRVLLPEGRACRDARVVLSHVTCNSRMRLASGMDHVMETDCSQALRLDCEEDRGRAVYSVEGRAGQTVRLTKFITYHSSRSAAGEELRERAERALDRAVGDGFEVLVRSQREFLAEFWDKSDVEVGGDPAVQQVIRFNLFHIVQASARAEQGGIPAKGLTGDGYEGHYFWDTEIYVLPFLIYTQPRLARNLLLFRYRMLERARQRAREVNQRGALFPWRTINGEEASAYYAAGTAQYHINADIIYALKKYVEVSGDEALLHQEGAEMLVETARLWADLGFFSSHHEGKFCIIGVTGPDEYNTVVNNNAFTNLMARENLWYAADTVEVLRRTQPARFEELAQELKLDPAEIVGWRKAADNMYLPYDESAGIHLQDDEFLERKPWDFKNTPPDKFPLLLHFHPLVIYRHQVIKQADVVLAMLLLGHQFTLEQKRRNFDFYDPLTTGDSSLSVAVQSILAFELGYLDKAREYARYALLMDLADVAANVEHGCHIACMGSTWMAVIYGVVGLRDHQGEVSFNPKMPERFSTLKFSLMIRGRHLRVEMDRASNSVTYSLQSGPDLEVNHKGEKLRLAGGKPVQARINSK